MKRKKLDEAADLLRERAGGTLDAAIILGSGFGGVLRDRVDAVPLAYKKIAGMPEPTVPGHAGEALVGTLHGTARLAVGGYVAGGRAALDSIAGVGYDVLAHQAAPGKRTLAAKLLRTVVTGR